MKRSFEGKFTAEDGTEYEITRVYPGDASPYLQLRMKQIAGGFIDVNGIMAAQDVLTEIVRNFWTER